MYHNKRDSSGKFAPKSAPIILGTSIYDIKWPKVKPAKLKAKPNELQKVNYVAIALDRSGSMKGIRQEVIEQYNKQIETLREESKKHNIKTYLSLFTFSYDCDPVLYHNRPIGSVPLLNLSEYRPTGQTALRDAIGTASESLAQCNTVGVDYTCLLIVITDGLENNSTIFVPSDIPRLIRNNTQTDRWTYVALCPESAIYPLEALGFARGNIQAWEATRQGTQVMGQQVNYGTQSYYGKVARGIKTVTNFFSPDFSSVTGTALKKQLVDDSQNFLRLNVTNDARIDEFVEKTTGNKYTLGSGLYQLTKQENVQDYKKIVVQNKTTNELYSGVSDVRRLLKLPEFGTHKIRPSVHSEYIIYVQSTVPNRKLIAGTTLLLDKSLI